MGKGEADAIKQLGLNSQEIMNMINAGGDQASKAYEMINVAIAGVKNETDRTAITTALYGTQSEDVGKKVMEAMRSVTDTIGDTTGAAQQLNETVSQTPAQQMQAQWNTLKDSLIPLANTMMDLAQQVMPYVTNAVEKLTGFLSGMSPETRKLVVVIGAVAGALGAFLVAIAPIVSTIGTLIPIIAKVGGAIAGLGTPIGWAVLAITGLIAVGVALYKNSETVRDAINKAWKAIGEFIKNPSESAKAAVDKVTGAISRAWTTTIEAVKMTVDRGFKLIEKYVIDPINSAHSKVSKTLDNVQTKFSSIGSTIKTSVKNAFNEAKDFIVNPIIEAKNKISETIETIKGFFTNLKLKIPKIDLPSMPKIELKTSTKSVLGKDITYPSGFDVNWNAKGGVFKKPTIFATPNAGLQGVGEAGAEAILPLNNGTYNNLAQSIVKAMGNQKGGVSIVNNITTNKPLNEAELARIQRKEMERAGFAWG